LDYAILSCSDNQQDILDIYEKIEIISNLFTQCLSNKIFYNLFMTNSSLLTKLNNLISSNFKSEMNSKELITILIKINENILKEFGNQVTPVFTQENQAFMFNLNNFDDDNNQNSNDFNKSTEKFDLQTYMESIIDTIAESTNNITHDFVFGFKNNKFLINTTFDRPKSILGGKILVELEYVKSIVDILINAMAKGLFVDKLNNIFLKIIKNNFFIKAIEYFYSHEFNNSYQKLFEQLIILITNKYSPKNLLEYVFSTEDNNASTASSCNFLNSVISHCNSQENLKFTFK
jgi:hypothetical protein